MKGSSVTAIYRDFDQASLDREYFPASPLADMAPFIAAYAERSRAARAAVPGWRSLRWGEAEGAALDFFPARAGGKAQLHVFIHGGFWRRLSKEDSSFPAPGFTAAGIAYAALDYALAPAASLAAILGQCRDAIAWLHAHAAELGFDPGAITVSGSSAGGHLAAMLLATDWRDWGLPEKPVRACVALSGLFDLEPVRLCYANASLGLDEDDVPQLSPIHRLPPRGARLLVAVGEIETAEFQRQSRDYAAACAASGVDCTSMVVPGRNHFDLPFDLADPATVLGAAVRAVSRHGAGPC
jgi:arylformamidase